MSPPSIPFYVWCFSHGVMHRFTADHDAWCTAVWVAFLAGTEELALESKTAAYGDARFFDELTSKQKLEVLEISNTWRPWDEGEFA